jgi:hypothetical protein
MLEVLVPGQTCLVLYILSPTSHILKILMVQERNPFNIFLMFEAFDLLILLVPVCMHAFISMYVNEMCFRKEPERFEC